MVITRRHQKANNESRDMMIVLYLNKCILPLITSERLQDISQDRQKHPPTMQIGGHYGFALATDSIAFATWSALMLSSATLVSLPKSVKDMTSRYYMS